MCEAIARELVGGEVAPDSAAGRRGGAVAQRTSDAERRIRPGGARTSQQTHYALTRRAAARRTSSPSSFVVVLLPPSRVASCCWRCCCCCCCFIPYYCRTRLFFFIVPRPSASARHCDARDRALAGCSLDGTPPDAWPLRSTLPSALQPSRRAYANSGERTPLEKARTRPFRPVPKEESVQAASLCRCGRDSALATRQTVRRSEEAGI